MNFKQFLAQNGLKQIDIVRYLGLSKPYISKIASGRELLPKHHLQKLLDNPDWDTSSLTSDSSGVIFDAVSVQVLKMRIEELEKQNKEYCEVIKTLTSKINV